MILPKFHIYYNFFSFYEVIKQIFPNGKEVYFFAQNKSTQVTYPDGFIVYKFANGQIEKVYLDNSRRIIFQSGEEKYLKEYEIDAILTQ